MIDESQLEGFRGATVLDRDGDKIGKVEDIYLDDSTNRPEWVAVKTGFFGSKVALVPLASAEQRGDDLVVPYEKSVVKDAPHQDVDQHLSPSEEADLYAYYGVPYGADTVRAEGTVRATGTEETAVTPAADYADTRGSEGRDVSGPTTDDAMTRSEERLRVGTQNVETGRARLRKYVVTEHVEQTVPVRRERVRLEREPITDANIDQAMGGPEISEEEHEVVLHEERPVVSKETVPVERVRLDKDVQTEQVTVGDDLRKEQIELEGVDVDASDSAAGVQRDLR